MKKRIYRELKRFGDVFRERDERTLDSGFFVFVVFFFLDGFG